MTKYTKPLDILSGIHVLSFAQLLQAPAGVQMLADMGADVIKVEKPGVGAWERNWAGGNTFINGVSVFFLAANRNQRSISLNLKSEEAREIVLQLVDQSDVFVENFRPGVMDRLGLAYESVRERNPKIVYCSCTGYGSEGPYRDRAGQDLLTQCLSGLASITGRSSDPPTPTGAPITDQHAAALLVCGVLAALFHRTRTGEGQKVEVSLLQSALDLQMEPLTYYLNGGNVTNRSSNGLGSPFHAAPYGVYQTNNGYIVISINPLPKLAELIGEPKLLEYDTETKALEHKEAIKILIQSRIINQPSEYWLELFTKADIWCGPVLDYEELIEDPQIKFLDPFVRFNYPGAGEITALSTPLQFSSGEAIVRQRPPLIGEHTDQILKKLGYTADKIQELHAKGIV